MKQNICFIGNIGPHYRFPIYNAIGQTFACDFYFGDHTNTPIETFDYKQLKGFKTTLINHYWGNFYWQSRSLGLITKGYTHYILNGEPYCLSSWFLLLGAKLFHKQTIAWTHGIYGHENFIKRKFKKVYYSLFTKLMVYNEYSIKQMEKEGIDAKKFSCIANSMDSDKELKIRKDLKTTNIYYNYFGNKNPIIIYCGRIQKRKQLDMIIDCIKLLKDEGQNVNAVFVGKDVDNVNIYRYAKKLGVDSQLWMYGPCYDDTILAELYYNANICVSPGNIGLTAIHAMTFGCPCITHDDFINQMPEFEAIKPGKTGDFFKRGDIKDLKEKVKNWLSPDVGTRNQTRFYTYAEIDNKWNIHYQIKVLKKVLGDNQ